MTVALTNGARPDPAMAHHLAHDMAGPVIVAEFGPPGPAGKPSAPADPSPGPAGPVGPQDLVAAYDVVATYHRPDAWCVVVATGDWARAGALGRFVAQRKLTRAWVLGSCTPAERAALVARADVWVSPDGTAHDRAGRVESLAGVGALERAERLRRLVGEA